MATSEELREFLATRRAHITPQQAGLPSLGHRRVPGLRREEVATLTGVSSEYYTRLERGNANGVSESVLEALARALQLDDAERAHLYNLVRASTPAARATRRPSTSRVRPAVQRLLDRMSDVPAFIQNGRLDMLAANTLARALYCDLYDGAGVDERTGVPNHGRFVFLDPRAADMYPDWNKAAGDTVTQLRAEAGRRPDDRELNALIGELSSRSPQFAALWATHNVRWHTTGTKKFHHRVVGHLELDYEAMALAADPGHVLVTFTAAPDTPSAQALAFLTSWAAAPTAAAATNTPASGSRNAAEDGAAANTPAVNSSESPGRKNPINSPVSANSTTATPSDPNDDNSECGLRTLTVLPPTSPTFT